MFIWCLLYTDLKGRLCWRLLVENPPCVVKIAGRKRVISTESRRRAHCCVAAGLLTGVTELSARLGTIRAISPPSGGSLKHSPSTFHTLFPYPYLTPSLPSTHPLFPCQWSLQAIPLVQLTTNRQMLENDVRCSHIVFTIHSLSGNESLEDSSLNDVFILSKLILRQSGTPLSRTAPWIISIWRCSMNKLFVESFLFESTSLENLLAVELASTRSLYRFIVYY